MTQITSEEFKAAIELDPAWASKLTEPVEIVDSCDASDSNISHLSPLLHFKRDAFFAECHNLKKVEGNFAEYVNFYNAGIEEIDPNTVFGKNEGEESASYKNCLKLKIARGKYPGLVTYQHSGVEKIDPTSEFGESLISTWLGFNGKTFATKTKPGMSADFSYCLKLKIGEGTYPNLVVFSGAGIEKIENLHVLKSAGGRKIALNKCQNLDRIPTEFQPHEVFADKKLLNQLKRERADTRMRSDLTIEI